MRRQAWTMVVGVVVGLVVLAAGAAWLTLQPGGPAWPGAAAKAAGAAASAPLLFRANEVVQPVLASLPQRI